MNPNNNNGYTTSPTGQCAVDERFALVPPSSEAPSLVSLLSGASTFESQSPRLYSDNHEAMDRQSLYDILSSALDVIGDSTFDDECMYYDSFTGSKVNSAIVSQKHSSPRQ